MSYPIDTDLIKKIAPYLVTDYEKLHYNATLGLKNSFISGRVKEFQLTYNQPKEINYVDVFSNLDRIGTEIAGAESVVSRAYLPKLQEIKNRYRLLQATAKQDDQSFFEQSEIIYGLPKLPYYQYAMRSLAQMLAHVEALGLTDVRVKQALATLAPLQVINTKASWDSINLPAPVVSLDNHILTTREIKQMCEQAFTTYGVFGWRAIVAHPGARITFNVNHTDKVLNIPHDHDIKIRKYPLTRIKMEGLIAHEIGTHIIRRQNGESSPLALLGSGLAGYLPGEEGIATYREQFVRGTNQFSGQMGYLAISWVVGLDGTPRTFRELFDIMVPYLFVSIIEQITLNKLPLDLDLIEAHMKRNAWARCIRTFRGVTGQTRGCCLTRDIIYLEGNIAIWQLLEADPTRESNFSLGKFDPTNKEHISILRQLGLIKHP